MEEGDATDLEAGVADRDAGGGEATEGRLHGSRLLARLHLLLLHPHLACAPIDHALLQCHIAQPPWLWCG